MSPDPMAFSRSTLHLPNPSQLCEFKPRCIAMNSATAQPRQLYREPCGYGISVPRSKATFTTCSASFSVQKFRPLDRNRKHEGPCGPAHRQRGCTAGPASTRRQTVAPCRAVETQRGGISGFAEEAYRCAKTPFGALLVILSRMNILDRKPGLDIWADASFHGMDIKTSGLWIDAEYKQEARLSYLYCFST